MKLAETQRLYIIKRIITLPEGHRVWFLCDNGTVWRTEETTRREDITTYNSFQQAKDLARSIQKEYDQARPESEGEAFIRAVPLERFAK